MDDLIHGALLGTMVGDALGRPYEGTPAGDLDRLRQLVQRRAARPFALSYSDDAEMMLGVAESLVAVGAIDEAHLLETLSAGHDVARGYGKGTRAAFRVWRQTGSWELASRAMWPGGSRGNGAAVRVAPVAVLLRGSGPAEVVAAARRSAAPTHLHEEAQEGAATVALAVWLSLRGVQPGLLLDELLAHVEGWRIAPRLELVRQPTGVPDAVATLGHGVFAFESVPVAVWACSRSETFEQAVITAVCCGGDTDSIAAIAGAIAGATHGATAIPSRWLDALEQPGRRRVHELAERLVAVSS